MLSYSYKSSRVGFSLVELMIVVAVIGLLASLAIPSFVRARETSMQTLCIDNLRQMSGAKDIYALSNGNAVPGTLTDLVTTFIKRTPECPAAGVYLLGALNDPPTCTVIGHQY